MPPPRVLGHAVEEGFFLRGEGVAPGDDLGADEFGGFGAGNRGRAVFNLSFHLGLSVGRAINELPRVLPRVPWRGPNGNGLRGGGGGGGGELFDDRPGRKVQVAHREETFGIQLAGDAGGMREGLSGGV